jgi:plastocyanin
LSARAPERGILPIALPIALLAMIASAAFLFSRVLLNVHKDVAVAVALMTAFNLLAFFAFMSSRIGKANPIEKVMALGVLLLPMALGTAVALKIIPTKAEGGKEVEAGPPVVNLVAKDLKFDKSEIDLVANVENTIDLDNQDTQPHNVVVFAGPDASAPPLNDATAIANAGQKVPYKVKAPGPGTYFFHCAIHPSLMKGEVVVKEGAAGGKKEAGGGPVALSAKDLKFDKAEITVPANKDVTIDFDNKDTQPHNVVVFNGADATAPRLDDGQPIANAGQKVKYKFKSPGPGTYFFHCDVHPAQMTGKVVVK